MGDLGQAEHYFCGLEQNVSLGTVALPGSLVFLTSVLVHGYSGRDPEEQWWGQMAGRYFHVGCVIGQISKQSFCECQAMVGTVARRQSSKAHMLAGW